MPWATHTHQPLPGPHKRASAARRGYDRQWRKLSRLIILRDPVCTTCHREPSAHADHVVPREQGGSDDPANLQGLCHGCHSRKTATQDGGFGR